MRTSDKNVTMEISLDVLAILAVVLDYCVRNEEHFKADCRVSDMVSEVIKEMLEKTLTVLDLPVDVNTSMKPKNRIIN